MNKKDGSVFSFEFIGRGVCRASLSNSHVDIGCEMMGGESFGYFVYPESIKTWLGVRDGERVDANEKESMLCQLMRYCESKNMEMEIY